MLNKIFLGDAQQVVYIYGEIIGLTSTGMEHWYGHDMHLWNLPGPAAHWTTDYLTM